ncbi:MAG: hypothetical protein B6I20_04125 [Bacteroidetes bacterium 4572_117]|nr:MAG: hypothetical protein B6I20_04125 [Bacteroidetes bacterium 4572_117]
MNLIYYNELDYSKVTKQFKKVEKFLANNDFQSADIKKITNTDYYRARLDIKNRLLFKFAKYDGRTYILLLEVILNHDYDKSKFLNGTTVNEDKFQVIENEKNLPKEDVKQLVYLNKNRKHFNLLDKIISFDDAQDEIYSLPTPLIIIGSAGSGKTILTLEKLKKLHGNVAYISLSSYLVENAQNIYYSNNYENPKQEIDFLSFNEYIASIRIPKGSELQYRNFEQWFIKHIHTSKFSEPYRLFEEFKGVLTGSVTESKYLLRAEYLKLGVKQSIFTKNQRDGVYDIFEKYLKFLEQSPWYDINMLSFEYLKLVEKRYDFVVVDEVQDITLVQLKLIINSLKTYNKFILSGDSNQIVHPNFFSWSKIKTLFYKSQFNFSFTRILKTNYRNSQQVTGLSNTLLKIKNTRFGSIDKESTYLIDSVSEKKGSVFLYQDNNKLKKQLNSKTQASTKFAVLVMNNKDKKLAQRAFKTPLIFSIQEAKGLEYENIILLNFISDYEKEFFEITRGVTSDILDDEIKYARARNKEDKDLEVYKFFINSLYVAFTRSVQNLHIIESNKNHRIFELLKLKEINTGLNIQTQKSDEQEWLEEADKLEKQGKIEQAQQIRDKIAGVKYISDEEFEKLKEIALDKSKTEQEVKRQRKDLFKYAVARRNFEVINNLAELKFIRAVSFISTLKAKQKILAKNCRLNRKQELASIIKEYGVDFRSNEELMTGLMLAVYYNSEEIFDFYINNQANIKLSNANGLIPLQIAINSTYTNIISKENNQGLSIAGLEKFYNKLKTQNINCELENKLRKINNQSMEYFLLHYLLSVQEHIIIRNKKEEIERLNETIRMQKEYEKMYRMPKQPDFDVNKAINNIMQADYGYGLKIDDFLKFIEKLPNSILPEYRRKRSYVNSILANNEIDRNFMYNKKLFKRIDRGVYKLNPNLRVSH